MSKVRTKQFDSLDLDVAHAAPVCQDPGWGILRTERLRMAKA